MGHPTTIVVPKELPRNMSWEDLISPFASGSEGMVHTRFFTSHLRLCHLHLD